MAEYNRKLESITDPEKRREIRALKNTKISQEKYDKLIKEELLSQEK